MSDGRPADIPQDVWSETGMEFDKLYDAEPDLEGGCEQAIRYMAARMVVAERERCARVALSFVRQHGEPGAVAENPFANARNIASSIRSSHE